MRALREAEAAALFVRNSVDARALSALRRLLPSTLTDADPSPHDIVFGPHASEIYGRCSVLSRKRDELVMV